MGQNSSVLHRSFKNRQSVINSRINTRTSQKDINMKHHFHLIGVNGIGLSGVARILLEMGHKVSGSDPKSSVLTETLSKMGACIYHEHKRENIEGADYIVVSSAINYDNPEIQAAQELGIPVVHRAQMLGCIMKGRTGIAISGTHGKTTTSSMMAHLLESAGLDPTIAVGGQLNGIMTNAKLGTSDLMVIEADESDASFLYLDPRWIVVTSVDVDVNLNVAPYSHLNFDYDKTLEKVKDAFFQFLDKIPDNGSALMCIDDENVRKMLPLINKSYKTYGLSQDAYIRAENVHYENFGSRFEVYYDNFYMGIMELKVPGRHNVQNSLAVIALGLELGLSFQEIAESMKKYSGVKRRFELLGEVNDIRVYDDYAHNPGKVQALLSGAKTGGRRRVIAVFQPHRYTRTKFLFNEFANSFSDADVLVITDIYEAGEVPILGVKGETLAQAIESSSNAPGEVHFIQKFEDIIKFLKDYSQLGDIIVTCGAGDIYRVGEDLVSVLSQNNTDTNQIAAVG
jgi:UDP-N-acetylmuramate--alanine ligase